MKKKKPKSHRSKMPACEHFPAKGHRDIRAMGTDVGGIDSTNEFGKGMKKGTTVLTEAQPGSPRGFQE